MRSSRTASAALNRQALAVSPIIRRQLVQRLRQIEASDEHLKMLRNADPDLGEALRQRPVILTSIPGLGEGTADVLMLETPELGGLEHAQAASLVSLAAVPRDSDQTQGKPSAAGARVPDRLSTRLNAIRLNPQFKAK